MSQSIQNFSEIQDWFNHGKESSFVLQNFCPTRSELNGRLNSYESLLRKSFNEDCLYLFLSSLGEVGNNCFDHNLGHWQGKPGCLFVREEKYCIIADRGQGIKSSLSKVINLEKHNPIEYAYLHVVSGRAPEKRGNGLKHVRRSIVSCHISLSVYSGGDFYSIGKQEVKNLALNNPGVFVLFTWK
jgi:hypothetical protein